MTEPVLELRGVRKAFGDVAAVDDVDLAVADHELRRARRPERVRQVDAAAARRRAGRRPTAATIRIGGDVVDDGVAPRRARAPPHRARVPGARPVPAPHRRRQHRVRAARRCHGRNAAGACDRLARRRRPRRPRRPLPARAVRRRAPARRPRPGAGPEPRLDAARRAVRQPRPEPARPAARRHRRRPALDRARRRCSSPTTRPRRWRSATGWP